MTPVELGAKALWTLVPLSAMAGIFATIVFRWGVDGPAVRRASDLMLAHLLEFRLFLDEPVLVFRAQRQLFRANLKLLRIIFLPCMILGVSYFFLINYMNDWYGKAPLPAGQAAVIEARALNMPREIVIETPAVRIGTRVMWRVRPAMSIPVRTLQSRNPGAAIPFPPATILRMHWLIWFSAISAAAALGLQWLE